MRAVEATISGWGGYPRACCSLVRPEHYSDLFLPFHQSLIPRGCGRSYGDASLNSHQTVMLMERMNRFLNFDSENGLLRAEAGVTLAEILEVFVPKGWFLPVTPGTQYCTLGGCVAADVHGKNHHQVGPFSNFIKEITLILPTAEKKICSSSENSELFWATVGGLGLTGIIAEICLQLIPIETAFMSVKQYAAQNMEEALDLLSRPSLDTHLEDPYSVAWIDCLASGKNLGRSIVMNAHHAKKSQLPPSFSPLTLKKSKKHTVPFHCPAWVLNRWSVKAFNFCYFHYQKQQSDFIQDYESYFYPLDTLQHWNRIYGKRGFIQYQVVIPKSHSHEGLTELLEVLSKSQRASFLAVLKRFGKEEQGLLSFPLEGYTLALDIPLMDGLFPLLDQLDHIVLKYQGRVYLAKDARLKPDIFRQMYPRFTQWQKIKKQIDPEGILQSDLSQRLEMQS